MDKVPCYNIIGTYPVLEQKCGTLKIQKYWCLKSARVMSHVVILRAQKNKDKTLSINQSLESAIDNAANSIKQ